MYINNYYGFNMTKINYKLFDYPCSNKTCDAYRNHKKIYYNKKYVNIEDNETIKLDEEEGLRYSLKIKINLQKKRDGFNNVKHDTIVFVLMNPSHASKEESDNTINNCIEIATNNGCSNIEIYNLSPFRTASPKCLKKKLKYECPGISINKEQIEKCVKDCEKENNKQLEEIINSNNKTIVVAWGKLNCKEEKKDKSETTIEYKLKQEAKNFLQKCKDKNKELWCIAHNQNNSPRHPSPQSKSKYKPSQYNDVQWGQLTKFKY